MALEIFALGAAARLVELGEGTGTPGARPRGRRGLVSQEGAQGALQLQTRPTARVDAGRGGEEGLGSEDDVAMTASRNDDHAGKGYQPLPR